MCAFKSFGANVRLVYMLDMIKFDNKGLVAVVTQDANSGEILMLAYANREALEKTLEIKQAHYFSRSRNELWHKGASSGHFQEIIEIRYDCDQDAVLYRVKQTGAACHTGNYSCFYRTLTEPSKRSVGDVLARLEHTIQDRLKTQPEGSYVTTLYKKGIGYMSQKLVEEAGETIVAALQKNDEELLQESADLLFHLTVLLQERGFALADVAKVLEDRHKD